MSGAYYFPCQWLLLATQQVLPLLLCYCCCCYWLPQFLMTKYPNSMNYGFRSVYNSEQYPGLIISLVRGYCWPRGRCCCYCCCRCCATVAAAAATTALDDNKFPTGNKDKDKYLHNIFNVIGISYQINLSQRSYYDI